MLRSSPVKRYATSFDLIIIAGGDGTINQVVNGMGDYADSAGVIGCGTGNDFARALGMPTDPVEAVRQIMAGETQEIDLCRVNQSYFVSSVGVGFDGEVAFDANQGFRLGPEKRPICAVFSKPFFLPVPTDQVNRGWLVMEFNSLLVAVTNSPTYGGV